MILVLVVPTFVSTDPKGSFSYPRFIACFIAWCSAICGTAFAIAALRLLNKQVLRLISITLITLNGLSVILGTLFLIAGLQFLALEWKNKQSTQASRQWQLTNVTFRAYGEFRSNYNFCTMRYTNAAQALKRFNDLDLPTSSLKSKELLESRRTNFAEFLTAGHQFRTFYIDGPATFTREIENSGESPEAIEKTLRNFRKRELNLWDENYTVVEKTLQMTSNTALLNNLLASNYDLWSVSNASLVFNDANLQSEYFETVLKVKQLKSELTNAAGHLRELQTRRR